VDVNADARRANALQAMSVNPFGKNYPNDVNSPIVKRAVPGSGGAGKQMHHRAIVTAYEPFFTGLTANEQLALVEELHSMGVTVGNNPENITVVRANEHQGGIHSRSKNYGLEIKADDLRAKEGINNFLDKVRNASYDERVAMLPDFVKYGQNEVDRILRDEMGYAIPSRQDQIASYQSAVNNEHNRIVAAAEMGVSPEFSQKDLTKLLSNLKTSEIDPSFTGKAGDKIRNVLSGESISDSQGVATSDRSDSPGNNRDRALNIYAGGNVSIGEGVLRSNGNGNGNGHSKPKLPRRRG